MRTGTVALVIVAGICLAIVGGAESLGAESAAPEIQIPQSADVPVVMNFHDSDAQEMLSALSTTSGLPMTFDACVRTRRGALAMSNISVSGALAQIAKAFDLVIAQRGDSWHVSCKDQPESTSSTALENTEAPVSSAFLRFTIEHSKRKLPTEVIAHPSLLVPAGQVAEIRLGSNVTALTMTERGAFLATAEQPSMAIEVLFEPESAPEDTLRGIFRMSVGSVGTFYNLSGTFDAVVPPFGEKVELCRLRIPRESWILSVEREQ